MEVMVKGDGNIVAGGNVRLQIELTPESARMVAEALLQLEEKNCS